MCYISSSFVCNVKMWGWGNTNLNEPTSKRSQIGLAWACGVLYDKSLSLQYFLRSIFFKILLSISISLKSILLMLILVSIFFRKFLFDINILGKPGSDKKSGENYQNMLTICCHYFCDFFIPNRFLYVLWICTKPHQHWQNDRNFVFSDESLSAGWIDTDWPPERKS